MSPLDKLKAKPVLVYGAGAVARVILPYLICHEQIRLYGAAVTAGAKAAGIEGHEIPIKPIAEYTGSAGAVTVLIATSEQHHGAIRHTCGELGFGDVVPLTPMLKDEIILSYYQDFFRRKGVSLEEDDIQLGAMRFLNPIRQELPNGANLFSQLGDLVFPHEYDDWRMVAEGPYDWGDVSLEPGDVVLDCGANMGVFSVYAASRGCTSYAFEPTPRLQEVLKRHAEMNRGQIEVEPYAVSNRTGTAAFHLDPYSCGGNSLLVRSPGTEEMEVRQITLDEFVYQRGLNRVDFIKADIEGAERLMLEGAQQVLARFAPKLSICTYHLPDDKEVLTQLILQANPNYKIQYRWQKLYACV